MYKRVLSTVAKIAVSLVLLGYLAVQASNDDDFQTLAAGPKNWPVLLLGLPICLTAVTLTIIRWQMLVRTLGLRLSMREALRAGFLGYLVNLLPFGLVGGDSLKAVMLINHEPRRKTEAIATVLVDRVIGLYALLLLAAGASLFLPADQLARLAEPDRLLIERLSRIIQICSLVSSVGLVMLLIPGVTRSRLWDLLEHTPLVGGILHKLVGAMRNYRQRLDRLLLAVVMSLGVHLCYVVLIITLTIGLGVQPEHRPAVGSQFTIVPPSMIAGALPIGSLEIVLNVLYRAISPPGAPQNIGFLLALAYRVVQISIAMIGVGYWLTSRGEVKELIHEAETTPSEQVPEAPGAMNA